MIQASRRRLLALSFAAMLPGFASAQQSYFPPAGEWARKAPAELGIDTQALAGAVQPESDVQMPEHAQPVD